MEDKVGNGMDNGDLCDTYHGAHVPLMERGRDALLCHSVNFTGDLLGFCGSGSILCLDMVGLEEILIPAKEGVYLNP